MSDSIDELRKLQLRFQDYLEGRNDKIEQDVVSSDEARAEHRLAAYYNAYRIRLIDCLATDFSVLCKTLGEEAFELLILDYLKLHPSDHPSVRWLGKHMAGFLRTRPHPRQEFLGELADFEWNQGLCFDAMESDRIFTLEDIARIDPALWPQIVLIFHPSLRWLDLHWNVPPYWSTLDQEQQPIEPMYQQIPTRWLMWRRDYKPNWRSLEAAEAWAIEAAQSGLSFAELCAGLLEWIGEDEVAMIAAGFLKQWINDDMVVEVKT